MGKQETHSFVLAHFAPCMQRARAAPIDAVGLRAVLRVVTQPLCPRATAKHRGAVSVLSGKSRSAGFTQQLCTVPCILRDRARGGVVPFASRTLTSARRADGTSDARRCPLQLPRGAQLRLGVAPIEPRAALMRSAMTLSAPVAAAICNGHVPCASLAINIALAARIICTTSMLPRTTAGATASSRRHP